MPHDLTGLARSVRQARLGTAVGFFLDGLVFATWVTRIPTIQERLGLRNDMLGVTLLMISLGALIAMPVTGRVVVRLGSRLTSAIAVAGFGASLLLPALSHGIVALSVSLFLFGIGFGAVNVAINAQAVAVDRLYGRPIMASFHATFSLGGIAGGILGSVAAGHHLPPLLHFAVVAVPVVVVASLYLPTVLIADADHAAADAPRGSRHLSRLVTLGAIAFCSMFGEGAMADWSAVFLKQVSHTTAARAALGFAAYSTTMTLGRLVADRVTLAIGPVRIVRLGGILAGSGTLLAILLPQAATAIAGFALVGAGLSSLVPTLFGAAGRTPGVAASVAVAVVSTTGYFGFLIGPPLIGFVSQGFSLRWAIGLVVVTSLVAMLLAPQVGSRLPGKPASEVLRGPGLLAG